MSTGKSWWGFKSHWLDSSFDRGLSYQGLIQVTQSVEWILYTIRVHLFDAFLKQKCHVICPSSWMASSPHRYKWVPVEPLWGRGAFRVHRLAGESLVRVWRGLRGQPMWAKWVKLAVNFRNIDGFCDAHQIRFRLWVRVRVCFKEGWVHSKMKRAVATPKSKTAPISIGAVLIDPCKFFYITSPWSLSCIWENWLRVKPCWFFILFKTVPETSCVSFQFP